jgi:hypothetical protein
VFAGAGVGTENRSVMPRTLYEEVAAEIGLDPLAGLSFPAVMSEYERLHDRSSLLQKVKHRLDYIDSFPQIRSLAIRFHTELSTVYSISEIVTTNWDTYFEASCGANPIVAPDDYAFWTMPGRKVFKIHGSMNNVGSIVATEQDYERCYERLRSGVIGASLKHMLATKTLVFFGYSFRDEDFNKIYAYLHDEMGRILPRSFIVTLDEDFDADAYPSSTIIQTDGTYFLSVLKSRLQETHHFLEDARFDAVADALDAAFDAHNQVLDAFSLKKHPDLLYTCSYQDGLIDALERILRRKATGEYSHVCDVEQKISSHFELRRRNLRAKRYEDVAYIDGYKNGLIYLISDDEVREALPFYFLFGTDDTETFAKYERALKRAPNLHKAANARARKLVAPLPSDDLVYQHPPFFSFDP